MKNVIKLTPSEFYRIRRPEFFSDSDTNYDIVLTKELLAHELSQITTNQKQDEFEIFCRRLVEKLISPNLIPQVGPTGGGDGKTDSETYPVSTAISDRWFIPENGWSKDEKWAFAFSAKKTWKTKAESDIKNIISTIRDYTRIYFITNQTPSSKKKKEAQDEFIKNYNLDIVILDGKWILEKVYDNKLFDIVIDSLNLSIEYKNKKTTLGQNDANRIKRLQKIEENINNPKRYFEYDFQLVEDALEAAILSRKLETPREEIEGKFDRAFRFCRKLNLNKQWIRLHYQRAWTYLYYFDDFSSFINEFKEFKSYITPESTISEIELYVNLFNSLRGFVALSCNLADFQIDLQKEKNDLCNILDKFIDKKEKPCSSLIAKIYKSMEKLMDPVFEKQSPQKYLIELSSYIPESIGLMDFPFDSIKKLIEVMGVSFPNNADYDHLIDVIASIEEKRSSELSAGHTFLKRAVQKYVAKYYKESIIYYGKAVLKLAKEESGDGLYFALKGLGHAYNEMGLMWASNNCFISASSISFKSWYESGILDSRVYDCAKHLTINEEIIGRIPNFLAWHELFNIISRQVEKGEEDDEIPIFELIDACLAVRLLNTEYNQDDFLSYLPDILKSQNLWLSQNACLFKQGYIDLIIKDYEGIGIKDENELANHFKMVANQPFCNQMLYETNFLAGNEICLTSKIIGCSFNFYFENDLELLLAAETFAAFFESFLATSIKNVYPSSESISIKLIRNTNENLFHFTNTESSSEYKIEINKFNFHRELRDTIWKKLMEFMAHILSINFIIKNPLEHLENLFKKEEINERLTFIFEHRNFTINVLGDNPKLFFEKWIKNNSLTKYPLKRITPISYTFEEKENKNKNKIDFDNIGHNQLSVSSIIDTTLWDQAEWGGFGFFFDNQGLGVFLGFNNGSFGKKIFDNWIKNIGRKDKEEKIKITIIRGVDKNNPNWYRVHIGSDSKNDILKSRKIIYSTSRFHEMNARLPDNLNNLLKAYNHLKFFRFCPAQLTSNSNNIEPYLESAIIKTEIIIRNAWEIGIHDLESVAIKKGDHPIIPDNIKDAPVLEVLKRNNEFN